MKTKQQFEAICDGMFEANNYLTVENTASKKIEKVPGEPGTKERIEAYRIKIENGEKLFDE